MNRDVLDCKRQVMEMTSSKNSQRNVNGRKRVSLGTLLFSAVEEVHKSAYHARRSSINVHVRRQSAGAHLSLTTSNSSQTMLVCR